MKQRDGHLKNDKARPWLIYYARYAPLENDVVAAAAGTGPYISFVFL